MSDEKILTELRDLISRLQKDICALKEAVIQLRTGWSIDDQLMTRKEAAKYLRRSVSSLETTKDLKFYKLGGGKVLYKKSDLDAWSESYSVMPVDLKAIDKLAMEDVLKLREKQKKAS
jgi:excisionase family DNA binding protein